MTEANTYDEVPYPDLAFPQTHPNRIGAMASLFGMTPPPPETARVLELGCAAGANLLPMGVEFPHAEFLGLDLSVGQIEAGEAIRKAAAIENVTLRQADILQLDASLGKFDYIIAHGLFSWVPEIVQEKVLDICRDNLAPNGVAYISYNVYPGWHFRGALRSMMMYHAEGFADPRTRIQQGRALVDFLANHAKAGFYTEMLKAGAELIKNDSDNYLYHEYLEVENHPVYFHEFVRRANAKALDYLTGTQLPSVAARTLNPGAEQVMNRIAAGDRVRTEQYTDFLTNRTFRESLLVHQAQPVRNQPDWQPIRHLWISHSLLPKNKSLDPGSRVAAVFASRSGVEIALKDPFVKTALMVILENHGNPVHFPALLATLRARMNSTRSPESDEAELGRFILELLGHGVAEVFMHPWPSASATGERPRASRLARAQAAAGRTIVTLRHQRLDDASADHRRLIELFDGEATLDQAIERMFERVDMNRLPEAARKAAGNPARLRGMFEDAMRQAITELRDLGLFLE